jgi:hypothetical protein
MDFVTEKFLRSQISMLRIENEMIHLFSSTNGFESMVQSSLPFFKNNLKDAFDYVNLQHQKLFGQKRFIDFTEYQAKQSAPDKSVTLTRNFLKQWFATRGFDAWMSFSPLVLHYYPEIGAARLRAFWDGKNYDAETVKLVDYVKQIIG